MEPNDTVPIRTGICSLDLPLSQELQLSKIKIGDTVERQIVLLSDPECPIGLIGTFLQKEEADTFALWTFGISERFQLISIDGDFAEGFPFSEEFGPDEQELPDIMDILFKHLSENSHLIGNSLTKKLSETKSYLDRMDLLADELIKDNTHRLNYVLSTSNTTRWTLVSESLKSYIQKSRIPLKKNKSKSEGKRQESSKVVEQSYVPLSLEEKVKALILPDEVKESVYRELEKLDRCNKQSTEYSMVADYLTWITEIPWGKYSNQDFELIDLKTRLDKSHSGLIEVKDHIVEHFCIEKISGNTNGTVMCFNGPPGTGKTTIAKEIARISNRPLVTIALGSMNDDAELRGHRRTYLNSRIGRVIAGLKTAKIMNPLFLLDEVDKLDRSRGDPTGALLELLDPAQNNRFVDRYLEFPVDLSKAFFICTSNDKEAIHPALFDRMELIEFRAYNEQERLHIIHQHLIPKIVDEYKLHTYAIIIKDEVIEKLGKQKHVRQIEKKLRKLFRMAATKIYIDKVDQQIIDIAFAGDILKTQEKEALGFRR